jgi:hypothetical protein
LPKGETRRSGAYLPDYAAIAPDPTCVRRLFFLILSLRSLRLCG